MLNRLNKPLIRTSIWPKTTLLGALLVGGLVLWMSPASAQEGSGTVDAFEWAMLRAETDLGHAEYQSAEGAYRTALLEGYFLLGQLEAAEDQAAAARDAFEEAARAAATGHRRAHHALAQAQLQMGDAEVAARLLRVLVGQEPGDPAARGDLVRALALAGKLDDARRELGLLRPFDLTGAAALEKVLAEAEPPQDALLPTIEVGELSGKSTEERAVVREQVNATLARVLRNLGTLHIQADRVRRAGEYFQRASTVDGGDTSKALGTVDLNPALPLQKVKAQAIDPAALVKSIFGGDVSEPVMNVLRLLDDGQLDASEEGLRRLLAEQDDPEVRVLLGVLFSHRKQYDAAESEFSVVIAANPKSLSARQHLARVYLLSGRRDLAAEQLRFAAELGDLERDLALELAAMEVADERLAAANRQLRNVSRQFASTRATLELAEIAMRLRNRKLALDYAERARRLSPNSEEVLATHVRAALTAKIPSTATQSVEPLARMHPTVAEYQMLLGRVWIELGNPGEGVEPLLRAVELDPQYSPAFLPLGLALNHERRYDEARTFLTRHLVSHPEDLDALAALAEAEERLGDLGAAEARARGVLDHDANHGTAHLVIGMLHMRQERFAEARAAFEKSVEGGANIKAHYQLSLACARLGDRAAAEHHLEVYREAQKGVEATYVELEAQPTAGTLEKKEQPGETEN